MALYIFLYITDFCYLSWGTSGNFSDRLNIDDFEVEEEVRPDFPCPYCHEDFDIASLCSHLEEEHSSESRVTVSSFPLSKLCSCILYIYRSFLKFFLFTFSLAVVLTDVCIRLLSQVLLINFIVGCFMLESFVISIFSFEIDP